MRDVLAGRYRLTERLGGGGMGEVWRGRDERLGRAVAVKLLRPELVDDDLTVARFHREARVTARLAGHPNIVILYDYGVHEESVYAVMELVRGLPLSGVLRERRRLPVPLAVRWGAQVCAGLAAAHTLGVVHRDVKPGNLMVTASGGDPDGEGTVKILDFGIAGLHGAAAHGRRPARTGDVFGTPLYMSPEQAQGLPVGVAGDLYSFGTILYRMLTGEPPFHAEDVLAVLRMHIHEAPRPPHRLRPDLPMELSDLVLELLAKDPWRRPRDAAQVGARLAALLAGTGTARRATVATPPPAATVPAAPPPGPLGHRALEQGPVDIGERAASGGAAADALAEPVDVPGEDLPETLRARRGQALRWDRAGAPERAVELFGGLLPDVERLYGPRHPETLTVRHHLAVNMSRCGRHAEAARLRAALLPDLTAAYGEGSERVLLTRLHLAFDVGGAGHHRRAAVLLGELVGDLSRALGPDDPNTLAARHHRAAHTGHAGDPAGAARQYHDLLADQVRLYGSEDARTARARDRLAHWWERAH